MTQIIVPASSVYYFCIDTYCHNPNPLWVFIAATRKNLC